MSVTDVAAKIIASGEGYQEEGAPGVDMVQVQKRYGEERAKRLRDDGNSQFIEISLSDKFASFLKDPWVDSAAVKDVHSLFPDHRCQLLVLGAGLGGLLYAVRMIEAGIHAQDIRMLPPKY